ncbi:MAG TPA: RelA/SpoT domain-containing protein [Actinomycetota bacterium]|nr:RelA/SpoT domain-containing protein [Actinomycetota bacterium]
MTVQILTNSQINKAGKALREWWDDFEAPVEALDTYLDDAFHVLVRFRAAHQRPMTKATRGLRMMVATEGAKVEVSQRLKRIPTIVDKLSRQPSMKLANMHDIAGCRAVLQTVDEVRRVERRLSRNRPPVRVYDYIEGPRESGYRGVHVIVLYDNRKIEVQLRTRVMHDWAIAVERLGGRLQTDLKSGRGPAPLLAWLSAVSEAMALEEAGEVVDTQLVERIQVLRKGALPYLQEGRP